MENIKIKIIKNIEFLLTYENLQEILTEPIINAPKAKHKRASGWV